MQPVFTAKRTKTGSYDITFGEYFLVNMCAEWARTLGVVLARGKSAKYTLDTVVLTGSPTQITTRRNGIVINTKYDKGLDKVSFGFGRVPLECFGFGKHVWLGWNEQENYTIPMLVHLKKKVARARRVGRVGSDVPRIIPIRTRRRAARTR